MTGLYKHPRRENKVLKNLKSIGQLYQFKFVMNNLTSKIKCNK